MINACLKDQELNLFTGNHDWTHIDDLVSAIVYFSDKTLLGEIINTATGVMASNETVVELIQKICGKEIKIKKNNDVKLGDSSVWVADISKALLHGWKHKIGLQEGIERTINDYRTK